MIDKATFVRYMETLKKLVDDIEGVDTALKKLDPDFGGLHIGRVGTLVLDILEAAIGGGSSGDLWTDYYVYEMDWGTKWKPGYITAKDGTEIPLATLSDLYDLLVQDSLIVKER